VVGAGAFFEVSRSRVLPQDARARPAGNGDHRPSNALNRNRPLTRRTRPGDILSNSGADAEPQRPPLAGPPPGAKGSPLLRTARTSSSGCATEGESLGRAARGDTDDRTPRPEDDHPRPHGEDG
jgi:hypothetical protein